MPNHQASEQMLGYLYQVRYALALLMKNIILKWSGKDLDEPKLFS